MALDFNKKLILLLADTPFKIYFLVAGFVFCRCYGISFYKLRKLERKIKVASIITFKEEEKLSKDRVIKMERHQRQNKFR